MKGGGVPLLEIAHLCHPLSLDLDIYDQEPGFFGGGCHSGMPCLWQCAKPLPFMGLYEICHERSISLKENKKKHFKS